MKRSVEERGSKWALFEVPDRESLLLPGLCATSGQVEESKTYMDRERPLKLTDVTG
jgi:hypothetical protein